MNAERATDDRTVGGWVRVLALLLSVWEPIAFAAMAAGAFNAVSVRGTSVALVLIARLLTTVLCVVAGRALSDRRPSAPALSKLALATSAVVQVVSLVTPYFPSNRLPGETPFHVAWTVLYYGAWFAYVTRSRRVAILFG